MKRDFLKNLGIDDEMIGKILDEAGKEVNELKTKIANLQDDLKVKDGVIETKNSKIKELENVDVEALKTAEYERGKAEGSAEIQKFKFNTALDNALKGGKVKDGKTISGLLDMEKIKLENEQIVGLDEQLKTLKESHDYLFENDGTTPKFSDNSPGSGVNDEDGALAQFKNIMGIKSEK